MLTRGFLFSSLENKENYSIINSTSKGTTQNFGEPELPTFSFNYSIENFSLQSFDEDLLSKKYEELEFFALLKQIGIDNKSIPKA